MVLAKVLLDSSFFRPTNLECTLLGGTKLPNRASSAYSWTNCKNRSEESANRIISELRAIQPDGQLTFIKKDLTLLKNVDEVCEEIKEKEKKLNLLFMTQGIASMKGRDGNLQKIDQQGESIIANYKCT